MLSTLLERLHLTRRRPQFQATRPMHIAVCPPALLRRRRGKTPAGATPLWAVRLEFMRALNGIRTPEAGDLLDRIGFARSLRELWHLRPDVFNLVAHYRDQAEADARLANLNRHFPKRAPSTGFGALDSGFHRTEVIA